MKMKKVTLCAAVCAMVFSASADVTEEVVVPEETSPCVFSSIYGGLGIGGSFLTGDNIGYTVFSSTANPKAKATIKPKANRFIGSVVLGGGKMFKNKVYAGAEFLMDFTKNKKHEIVDADINGVESKIDGKIGGFIPQINVKAGYVFKNATLAYAKLGCAWTKFAAETFRKDNGAKIDGESKTKASVVLGLGAEKAFRNKISAAIEGDYNFGHKVNSLRVNKGWSVRALVKYNVKY